jgi:parallel beta-helix repeat protein
VVTSAAHGYTTGDVLQVAGTTNYNGTSAAITVISTTSFSYLSAVNAATETTGTVATKLLFVASSANFIAGQQLIVQNDQGQQFPTTVSAVGSGTITLAAAVPTTWTGAARASVGAWVGSTLLEIAAGRTAIASGNGYSFKGLPDTLDQINRIKISARAFGAVPNNPAIDNTAALNAAMAAAAGLTFAVVELDASSTYYIAGTLLPPSGTTVCGQGLGTVIKKPSANYQAFYIDNKVDITIENLTIDGTATISGGGSEFAHLGIHARNSQRIHARKVVAHNLTIGIHYQMEDESTGNPLTRTINPVPTRFGVHDSSIMECICTDNKDHGISLFRDCSHNRVIGNICQRNGSHGISVDDGTVGDEARKSLDHPIKFSTSPTYNSIVGNICSDNTVTGITLSGCQHNTVTGNVCEANGVYKDPTDVTGSTGYFGVIRAGYGIELLNVQNHTPCRFNTISGNVCSNNRRAGITLLGADYNELGPNVITDNGNDWNGTPPAAGIWLLESASYQLPAVTAGYNATLSSTAASGATQLNVTPNSGAAAVGMGLIFLLSDGSYHVTQITVVNSATLLTISPAIPTGKSASSGITVAQPAAWGNTTTALVSAGATTVPVLMSTAAAVGMTIDLPLDNGTTHTTTIATIPNSTSITLTAAIPASRSVVSGTAIGQRVISFLTDPTLTGQSGPEFISTSRVGYKVVKNRQTNPNENDTEYNTLTAVSSGAKTVTLATPPTHPIPWNASIWQPYGSVHNTILGLEIIRTQTGRMLSGIRIQDEFCGGNSIKSNKVLDLTSNADNSWQAIYDLRQQVTLNHYENNDIDQAAHQGVVTLSGTPPSANIVSGAIRDNSSIVLSRKTAASTAANTGNLKIFSITPGSLAQERATILDADAALGATNIVVLDASNMAAGRTIKVALDAAAVTFHTTTVGAGYVSGTTIPLTVALPSAATKDWSVRVVVPAVQGLATVRSDITGDDGQVKWSVSN